MSEWPAMDSSETVVTKNAKGSVNDVVAKLGELVQARGLKLFAIVDHSDEARRAGLEDVYKRQVLNLLADRDQTNEVMDSIEAITLTYFGDSDDTELRPPAGFGACPAFAPDSDISRRLRSAYEATMPELYFGCLLYTSRCV